MSPASEALTDRADAGAGLPRAACFLAYRISVRPRAAEEVRLSWTFWMIVHAEYEDSRRHRTRIRIRVPNSPSSRIARDLHIHGDARRASMTRNGTMEIVLTDDQLIDERPAHVRRLWR